MGMVRIEQFTNKQKERILMETYGLAALIAFIWMTGTLFLHGDFKGESLIKVISGIVILFLASTLWPLVGVWVLCETISSLRERKKIEEEKERL
jgi:hypothetical protein